jgi:hypothetical protein
MSVASPPPPTRHEIDPISEALGELKADVRALRMMISGLYGLVIVGFTALGWLITRAPLH